MSPAKSRPFCLSLNMLNEINKSKCPSFALRDYENQTKDLHNSCGGERIDTWMRILYW